MTRPAPDPIDLVGAGILALFCAWSLVSAAVGTGRATNTAATCGLLATAYVVGRLTARWSWLVAVAVLAWFWLLVLASDRAFSGGPLAGPLHYANANAALATQVGAIALIASARSRGSVARGLLALAALTPLAMTVVNRSAAGTALSVALLTVAVMVMVFPPRRARAFVLGAGITLGVCVTLQLLVAAGVGDDRAGQVLSQRRVQLWSDALDLSRSHWLLGTGPQTFAVMSPTAASDPDTRAAHSVLLEAAAEIGLVGAALLLAFAVWAYLALDRAPGAAPAVLGALAWTAFCLHALVDYVADYPEVVASAALALGLAVGSMGRRTSARVHQSDPVDDIHDETDIPAHSE